MYAHRKGTDGGNALSKEAEWSKTLSRPQIDEHESHFEFLTADIPELPEAHSSRLGSLVMRCLKHNIKYRPTLEDVRRICQGELTRLDSAPGSKLGKRKRDDDDEASSILVGDEAFNQKVGRYRVGEKFRPKRLRTRIDITGHPDRDTYDKLLMDWSAMQRPTALGERVVVEALNARCDHLETLGAEYGWALRYLVSCLRKRTKSEQGGFFIPTSYIKDELQGTTVSMFETGTKIEVLEYLLRDGALERHDTPEIHDALQALNNAVNWGLLMLRGFVTPASADAGGPPAEPQGPGMQDRSALHRGIYDWIFIDPTGAVP